MKEEIVKFQVAPYALYDVLRALEVENNNNLYEYYEKGVIKEDNELMVWVKKQYLPKPVEDFKEAKQWKDYYWYLYSYHY